MIPTRIDVRGLQPSLPHRSNASWRGARLGRSARPSTDDAAGEGGHPMFPQYAYLKSQHYTDSKGG